jgi:hypothetical protein
MSWLWLIASIVPEMAPCLTLGVQDDPCRRPHCTLAEGDLPVWLSLVVWKPRFEGDLFELEPGVAVKAGEATTRLLERHRYGHGGWPDRESGEALVERGSVSCDPKAILALHAASMDSLRADCGDRLCWDIASISERNGRFELAEELLRAAIPAGSEPSSGATGWLFLGRFLGRRGRYQEALMVFKEYRLGRGGCGLGDDLIINEQLGWIERSCKALGDEAGLFDAWWRRLMNCKATGAAWQSADYFASKGFVQPEVESLRWFDSLDDQALGSIPRKHSRGEFVEGLESWRRWFDGERPASYVDVSVPGGVELAVSRARKLAASDPWAASRLLQDAAETGSPAAGIAILEMVADPKIGWKDSDREWLRTCWREGLLMRTYGCADPGVPTTW